MKAAAPPAAADPAADDRWLLGPIVAIAAGVRVWPAWTNVFGRPSINAQSNDAWYHLRLIEYAVVNYPRHLSWDPYAAPGGRPVPVAPLFDFLVATVVRIGAWLRLWPLSAADAVAAFAPVAFGVATVVLVYALGRRLFDTRAGLFAAALLATMPGSFLERTLLGYVDHHAAEACFSTLAALAIVAALDEREAARRRRCSIGAGLALGAYLLTWTSGAYFVAILAAWGVAQIGVDAWRHDPPSAAPGVLSTSTLVALAVILLAQDRNAGRFGEQVLALVGAAGAVVALAAARAWCDRERWSPRLVPLAMTALAAIALAGVRAAAPQVWATALIDVQRLLPSPAASTIGEVRPLALSGGAWSIVPAWVVFRTGFFLALGALPFLVVEVSRRRRPALLLVLVWTIVNFAATLGQNRFGYYLAIDLALLSGWLCSMAAAWAGRRRFADLVVVAIAAVAFYPNVLPAIAEARFDEGVPPGWRHALDWLRTSSPEPFGDPGAFTARTPPGFARESSTVLAWWDAGYWIEAIAHRVPVANPTQEGADAAARFFTGTDPAAALAELDRSRARFVVTSEQMPLSAPGRVTRGQWFGAMALWAGRPGDEYYDGFLERDAGGALRPVRVFYPEYYRAMATRLYVFGGEKIASVAATVISVAWRGEGTAGAYPEIVAARSFDRYDAALAYLRGLGPGRHELVGLDPFVSCVPLDRLPGVRLAYESPEASAVVPGRPAVRVFERAPGTPPA